MSTLSIVTFENLPTDIAMGQYLREASIDLVKTLRFDIGCIDHNKLREVLRLQRFVYGNFCYVDSDEDRLVREAVIRNTITKIYEL